MQPVKSAKESSLCQIDVRTNRIGSNIDLRSVTRYVSFPEESPVKTLSVNVCVINLLFYVPSQHFQVRWQNQQGPNLIHLWSFQDTYSSRPKISRHSNLYLNWVFLLLRLYKIKKLCCSKTDIDVYIFIQPFW